MILNDIEPPKQVVLMFFLQFLAAEQISRVNWMEINQDNLRTGTVRLSRVSWALLKLLVIIRDICASA